MKPFLLKRILVGVALMLQFVSAVADIREEQSGDASTQYEAIKEAYWRLMENGLREKVGLLMADSAIRSCFERDFAREFNTQKDYYFRDSVERCESPVNGKHVCSVLATLDTDKLKVAIRGYGRTCNVSRARLGSQNIVILRNKSDLDIARLANNLESELVAGGHRVRLFDKDTQVGRAGNDCDDHRKNLEIYSKKGSSYASAVAAYRQKVKECDRNKDVEYVLEIESANLNLGSFDAGRQSISGILSYRVGLRDATSGDIENAIPENKIPAHGFGSTRQIAEADLESKLYRSAVALIVKSINEIFINSEKATVPSGLLYTIYVNGLNEGLESRQQAAMVRDVIQTEYGVPPRLDYRKNTRSQKVYRVEIPHQIDLESVVDALYVAANQKGYASFRARVNNNSAIEVTF